MHPYKKIISLLLLTGCASLGYGQQISLGLHFYNPGDINYYIDTYGGRTTIDRTIYFANFASYSFGTTTWSITIPTSTTSNPVTPNTNPSTVHIDGTVVIDTSASAADPVVTMDNIEDYKSDNTAHPTSPRDDKYTMDLKTAVKGTYLSLDLYDGIAFTSGVFGWMDIPQPRLTITTPGLHCVDDIVTIQSYMWGNQSGLNYNWYYTDPSTNSPVFLTTTTTNSVSFSASQYSGLQSYVNSSTSNFSIYFFCTASTSLTTSQASLVTGVQFSPAAPVVGSVATSPGCGATGAVQVSNVTGLGNYAFVVLDQGASTTGCDPTNPSSCNSVEKSGMFNTANTTINGIAPGTYQLMIGNGGGPLGSCRTKTSVTVSVVSVLTQLSAAHTDVSCPGGSDGSIAVTTSGGQPGTVTYQLVDQTTGVTGAAQSTGSFNGLAAGTYTVNVVDGCGTTLTPTFTLTQPGALIGSAVGTASTCNNPGNGKVNVTAGGGSGTYNYNLFLSGVLVSSQLNSGFSSWEVDGLAPGSYDLQVQDVAATSCTGYVTTVVVGGPPALGLTVLSETDLICNGIAAGALSLSGSGGTGGYIYSIGSGLSNNTGIFSSLAAGDYTAVLTSGVSGCTDSYTYPVALTIHQPAAIGVVLSETDVTCNGAGNGSVQAVLSGGTGGYTLDWEVFTGGSWGTVSSGSAVNGGSSTVGGLSPGTYRLSVSDANGCDLVSSPVVLSQPDVLAISSVAVTDIVCYGEQGHITPVASGGNGGDVFSWTTDGNVFTGFAPGAGFGPGSYQIRVTDSKGCAADFGSSAVITAPAAALTFTDVLSDYNGYNVTCHGAATGIVTVAATGGNGASYSGYNFSLDGGAAGPADVLEGVTAGVHAIAVEDGRGCVVSGSVTLTQPASAMSLNVQSQTNNVCADGQAGVLTILASGGTSPYQYSIGGGGYQSSGEFDALGSGDYTIAAMDVNGCSLSGTYTVTSLYAPLVVTSSVQEVGCNGGADGSVELDVSGGSPGYTYQWSILNSGVLGATGSTATGLAVGTYRALITDAKGCSAADTAVVTQPSAIAAVLQTQPICSNSTNGSILVSASGGTAPYEYATSGNVWQADTVLAGLSAGDYTVVVTDSHGCIWQQATTITTNPLTPSVSFLVSTSQDALDTLQVEDISEPKPDSVKWSFAPQTILLGTDSVGPLISYSQQGTYPATVTAFYSGCSFPLTQNIVIGAYDPNSALPQVQAGLSFDSVLLAPNPSNGVFNLYVRLFKAQRLTLQVMNLNGQPIYAKSWDGQQLISEQVSLPGSIVSGLYIAELVTESEVRDYDLILTK